MNDTRRTKAERRAYYCASCKSHGDHLTDEHTDGDLVRSEARHAEDAEAWDA